MSVRKSRKKNQRGKATAAPVPLLIAWGIVAILTVLRLHAAFSGELNEQEAFLAVCGLHPQGAYVEGPAGVPLLLALAHGLAGSGVLALRWISPLAALLLSWCVWWMARSMAPRRPSVAFWSLIGVNLLPPVNLASQVMDGALVTASVVLLALVAGWDAATTGAKGEIPAWTLFGVALGVGTLFFAPVGCLLPVMVALWMFPVTRRGAEIPWRGGLIALGLLGLGWILPLEWNARHDWLQWSSVARQFGSYSFGSCKFSLSLVVLLGALITPPVMLLANSGAWWRRGIVLLFLGMTAISALVLLNPGELVPLAPGLPSPLGVQGVGDLAREIVSLRRERPDRSGKMPFLIGENSGLAALLGAKIQGDYPELPGAPPVFVAESPSLNSSYALWPSYADAVVPAAKDLLYTQEGVSPFLGRNALYITTESPQELPQTITGAFGAVGLLKEQPLLWNGREITARIYQCEEYRSLAL